MKKKSCSKTFPKILSTIWWRRIQLDGRLIVRHLPISLCAHIKKSSSITRLSILSKRAKASTKPVVMPNYQLESIFRITPLKYCCLYTYTES